MRDIGTDSDCTICVTNNGDIANVDFDLSDVSVSDRVVLFTRHCRVSSP